MPLTPGTLLGAYRIDELIGVGGMGEVYLAEDTRLNRSVAIKVISPHLASQEQFRDRFDREALTISQLKHPNVCTLHDVGHHEGAAFLVMEYVEGETLAERLARGHLSVADSLDIALQMARGLAHAHRLGIVHRDVKPANVMFADDGFVKLVDFGVAKSKVPSTITETGIAVGTLAYMAPEQLLPGDGVGPATDVWGVGVVLYEMLTGTRPFQGRDVGSLLRSILHDGVPSLRVGASAKNELSRLLKSALAKDPRERPTAADFAEQLASYRTKISTTTHPVAIVSESRRWWIPAALILLGAIGLVAGARVLNESRQASWARDQALPEIERLVREDRYLEAYDLALQASQILESDPSLERLWPELSVDASLTSMPDGAVVSVKDYADHEGSWRVLGRTPLGTRLPRGTLRFRFEHAGYEPVFLARNLTGAFEPPAVVLPPAGSEVDEVQVPGATLPVSLSGFETEALVTLPTFYIDRTEVTNRAFKAFVDASGYERAELWPAGAAPLSVYVDITGRRGPATWEAGDFPSGRGDEPVGGVSWYEASAYCAFRGRALPTVYHWSRAALAPREVTAPMGPSIVPLSNFGTPAPAPAGKYPGLGPYGTVDMAGNVREWTWNATGGDARRLILGGAWNDPDYMFSVPFSLPPADRSAANGFRCMRADSAIEPALLAPVDVSSTDYRNARPVPLEVFQEFAKQFAYVPSQAKAAIEGRETTPAGSLREHATIDVGYNGERMRVYVFLPQGVAPPYDAIIYFPALNAFQAKASSTTFYPADYVVKSGRAMVLPVFKGSFERWDHVLGLTGEEYMRAMHVRLTEWRQDLGRTIDYLASRGDINAQQVGYYGRSFGASMPLALLALEPRIATAVLYSGGFTYRPLPAATDPVNYVSRVTMPVLMLNGRHDYVLPYETSQKPLFRMFATPPADKKHVVYDAGHDALPRNQFIKEILAWLDRYLGAAK